MSGKPLRYLDSCLGNSLLRLRLRWRWQNRIASLRFTAHLYLSSRVYRFSRTHVTSLLVTQNFSFTPRLSRLFALSFKTICLSSRSKIREIFTDTLEDVESCSEIVFALILFFPKSPSNIVTRLCNRRHANVQAGEHARVSRECFSGPTPVFFLEKLSI